MNAELGPVTFNLTGITKVDREAFEALLLDLKAGMDRIAKAARRWVEFSEEVRAKLREAAPPAFGDMWDRLERIGNGSMSPMLYALHGRGAKLLAKMPVSDQERWLSDRVPVLVMKGNKPDELRVAVEHLSAEQQLQVFKVDAAGVRIRSIPEQRAWVEAQKVKREERESRGTGITKIDRPGRWRVEKGRVFVHPDKVAAGLTKNEVAMILRDLQQ
jgi:hypothetical protein